MLLAKQLTESHWHPKIGDPTLLGWLTVACYGLAAVACLICFCRRAKLIEPNRVRRLGLFWFLLGLAMAALAVNKQLDLQGLVHAIGRNMSIRQGWFEQRHTVMRWVTIGVGLGGLLSVVVMLLVMCGLWLRVWLAVAGVALLAGFAVLRTAELIIGTGLMHGQLVGNVHLSHLLELAAIALVIAGAWRGARRIKTDAFTVRADPHMTD